MDSAIYMLLYTRLLIKAVVKKGPQFNEGNPPTK